MRTIILFYEIKHNDFSNPDTKAIMESLGNFSFNIESFIEEGKLNVMKYGFTNVNTEYPLGFIEGESGYYR